MDPLLGTVGEEEGKWGHERAMATREGAMMSVWFVSMEYYELVRSIHEEVCALLIPPLCVWLQHSLYNIFLVM